MVSSPAFSQIGKDSSIKTIDVSGFFDGAHHWKDITGDDQVIKRLLDQKNYKPSQIKQIADNILLYQQKNGGWPKNYDMLAILTDEQKKILSEGEDSLNTTFDNGSTYSQIEYLAKAYQLMKDKRYKDACLRGIDFILNAQYNNGGFPQFFPDTSGYRKYITFNDDAMTGAMTVLLHVVQNKPYYSFIDENFREKIKKSFWKGIDCILKCQINEGGSLTVWCQQNDNVNLSPCGARTFELPGKVSEESANIVLLLMKIEHPGKEIINSVSSAVKWFKESKIFGIRIKTFPSPEVVYTYHKTRSDKEIVKDSTAPAVWTRFYQLGTNRPFFANRDGKMVFSLSEVDRERRTGYSWYVYTPQEVLDLYPAWIQRVK
jgi:PelA/Pel-15E family pectate lyase